MIACALAAIQIDADTLNEQINAYGINHIVENTTNPYSPSHVLPYLTGQPRNDAINALGQRYMTRAETWSPEIAAKASHARKKNANQLPPISLFLQVDLAIQAHHLSLLNESVGLSQQRSTSREPKSRKSSSDGGGIIGFFRRSSKQNNASNQNLNDGAIYYPRKSSIDQNAPRSRKGSESNRAARVFGTLEQAPFTSPALSARKQSLDDATNMSLLEAYNRKDSASSINRDTNVAPVEISQERRGSAEELLQQVLDECESLIGAFVPSPNPNKSQHF